MFIVEFKCHCFMEIIEKCAKSMFKDNEVAGNIFLSLFLSCGLAIFYLQLCHGPQTSQGHPNSYTNNSPSCSGS